MRETRPFSQLEAEIRDQEPENDNPGANADAALSDALGISFAIAAIGGLTLLSGIIVATVMRETLPQKNIT